MNAENQNLTDEEILERLSQDIDADFPTEDDDIDEKEKKVRHAFAQKKRSAKEAFALAEKYKAEVEALKAEKSNVITPPPAASASQDQAIQVLQRLTVQAMDNLGATQITEQNSELIRMERDRLYTKHMNQVEQRVQAEATAGEIIDLELSKIEQLEDVDVPEVKKRINGLDVLQRVDKRSIRQVVSQYLGEKVMSGQSTSGGNGNHTSTSSRESIAATASATSAVRNGRAGVGVRPGKGQGSEEKTPATPDEIVKMRSMGLHDVEAFRRAQKRATLYKGR